MKHQQVSAEEEARLWKEYQKNPSDENRNKLVTIYAGLVHYVAGKLAMHKPTNIEYEDLVNYGILGLINAIEKFDLSKGLKFSTYATIKIRGYIIDSLREFDWVPRQLRQQSKMIEKAYAELESKLGRYPKEEEVANYLGMKLEEFQKIIMNLSVTTQLSLEDTKYIGSDMDETSLVDAVEAPDGDNPEFIITKQELKKVLADAIMKLPENEKLVIALYYLEDLTLKEIGKVLNITESRACQLHSMAILRLRGIVRKEFLGREDLA
ncbi:MAG TPA: FliA/WhiG family RNA polymerase sigma factor [bacterium]|nr:FliA/WhiG family RNA polymerase sigma factor [bacterium]HPQ18248.1 FliA/WhiG family RNA polymerase sigma factor [bacterium]